MSPFPFQVCELKSCCEPVFTSAEFLDHTTVSPPCRYDITPLPPALLAIVPLGRVTLEAWDLLLWFGLRSTHVCELKSCCELVFTSAEFLGLTRLRDRSARCVESWDLLLWFGLRSAQACELKSCSALVFTSAEYLDLMRFHSFFSSQRL
jgi:hypothetical protein